MIMYNYIATMKVILFYFYIISNIINIHLLGNMDLQFLIIQIIYFYLNATFASEVAENIGLSDEDAQNRYAARVVGGKRAEIKDYPYNAFLDCGSGRSCGGVIIGDRWILTAGHCYAENIKVHVGTDSEYGGTRYSVKRAIEHPSFHINKTFAYYDYLLLELNTALKFTKTVKSIPIGSTGDFIDGEMLTLTGFGDIRKSCQIPVVKKFMEVPVNPDLLAVKLPLILHDHCLRLKPKYKNLMGLNTFCAGYKDGSKAASLGDSGSPVVFDGSLLGIVSGASMNWWCQESPEIYSSVPYVLEWIRNVTDIYKKA